MTRYIWMLPQDEQQAIYQALLIAGIEGEDLERAMDGRIIDLEDTIDVSPWKGGRR